MIASPSLAPAWQPLPLAPPLPNTSEEPARAQRQPPAHERSALATLAHELRGPLHSLRTSAALLAEDVDELSPDQVRHMVRAIERRALWLQGLTENLLTAASLERGGLSIQPRPQDLCTIVEETVEVLEPLLTQRRQCVEISLTDGPAMALVDERRVGQALANVLLNASKYSDPGTKIEVKLEPAAQSGRWRITVGDEGPGLPHGDAASLFEPYVRGDQTTDGLGLGLAVVKSIAAAHNGRVGAAPKPDRGAEFWIEL
jgi:signal transduction histidine kinase